MLTAIMSGITKEELVTILDEKLEEKFQRKFDELKQQIDHKLAPLQKMVDEVMETPSTYLRVRRRTTENSSMTVLGQRRT